MNLKERWARLAHTWQRPNASFGLGAIEVIDREADLTLFCTYSLVNGERALISPGSEEWKDDPVGLVPHRTAAARWKRFRELETKRVNAFYLHTAELNAIEGLEWRAFYDLFYCQRSCQCEPPWSAMWRGAWLYE